MTIAPGDRSRRALRAALCALALAAAYAATTSTATPVVATTVVATGSAATTSAISGKPAAVDAVPSTRSDVTAGIVRVRSDVAVGTVRATTVAISDGDSFVVRSADGARLRVRLAGIDAPEKSQPWANVARQHLREMLAGQELVLHAVKIDPFDRLVARVSVDGVDPALAMIEAGLAWHFARYDRDLPPALRKRYADAQTLARSERRGLWRGTDPEPPWEFRQRSRGNGDAVGRAKPMPGERPA